LMILIVRHLAAGGDFKITDNGDVIFPVCYY